MPAYRFAYDWVKPLYLGARLASSTKSSRSLGIVIYWGFVKSLGDRVRDCYTGGESWLGSRWWCGWVCGFTRVSGGR